MFNLLPKDQTFYDQLESLGGQVVSGARELRRLMQDFPAEARERAKALETNDKRNGNSGPVGVTTAGCGLHYPPWTAKTSFTSSLTCTASRRHRAFGTTYRPLWARQSRSQTDCTSRRPRLSGAMPTRTRASAAKGPTFVGSERVVESDTPAQAERRRYAARLFRPALCRKSWPP
jgi:hypothetical protein